MNYEKALELKNAGYPQKTQGYAMCSEFHETHDSWRECKKEHVYSPTLSELIAACGKNFGDLELKIYNPERNSQWIANPTYDISMKIGEGAGFSPEEAVANLWLKLNKK